MKLRLRAKVPHFLLLAASSLHANEPVRNEAWLLTVAQHAGHPVCETGCSSSEVEAHVAAGRIFLCAALESRREVSWRIYQLADGTYTFSWPSVGERGARQSRMPPLQERLRYVSAGHIHWDNLKRFSAQDWLWVTGNNRRLILITRDGVVREATPKGAWRRTRPGNFARSAPFRFNGRRIARFAPQP